MKCLLGLVFILSVVASPALAGGDEAPPWLRQAVALPVAAFDKKVSTVVLVDESTMNVAADGRVTTTSTYAIRILTREGRDNAIATVGYETDFEKVRDFHAWLIRPSGQVKSYGKDNTIDQSNANDVFDESRITKIIAREDAEAGSVFGYQVTTETRPYFNQSTWYFQGAEPVISSKVTLTLPAGWRATSITFSHARVEPMVSGTTYTWELRDLLPLEAEPASPSLSNLASRVAINYFPGEGTAVPDPKTFDNWTEVSRWYTALSSPQAVPNDAVIAKARELTANAKTELEKIRAVGRYVQRLQYISIQIGVGRWRPHAASDVIAKAYGDCKDKANLMRAMLKALNIESFPVLIYSGDPNFVQEIWPSPRQFNHCIIAIKVSDETQVASVLNHPALGRLLIFDATDDVTSVGSLPDHEQGSFALIAAGDNGALLRMPVTAPESNRLEREADVQLAPDGSITGTIKENSIGQSAVDEQRAFRGLQTADYKQMIEGWITRGATSAKVLAIEPGDDTSAGKFDLKVNFSASGYGQLMQDRLLVFKPAIVSRRESLFLTETTRKHPVVLEAHAFAETVRVKLPAAFEVDEMPDALKLDTAFGSYKTSYEVKNGELTFTRTLTQKASVIPSDQYAAVRNFYERIRAAEQAPVVLVKK